MNQRWMQKIIIFCLALTAVFSLSSCSGSASSTSAEVQATSPAATDPLPTPQNSLAPATQTSIPTNTQAAAPEVEIDPCALITKEEAEVAVGGPVKDPKGESYPPLYGCRYEAVDLINQLSISLVVYDSPTQALGAYQMVVSANNYEEVSGIGDRAFRPAIYDIDVLKGRYDLSIGVINDGDDEAEFEKAKELAALALDRLP